MSFLAPARGSGRRGRQRAIGRALAAAPSPAVLRRNISDAALAADAIDADAGMGWYAAAHEIAADLSPSITTAAGAGILAALSPQIGWVDNVAAARLCAIGADELTITAAGALGENVRKAIAIRDGGRPYDILGGRKVRSFYVNILRPTTAGAVTIDRHAVAIALYGIGAPSAAVHEKYLERAAAYQWIAAAYRAESRVFGILPHQLQAIAWLAHRHELDRKAAGNLAAAHRRQRRNDLLPEIQEDF